MPPGPAQELPNLPQWLGTLSTALISTPPQLHPYHIGNRFLTCCLLAPRAHLDAISPSYGQACTVSHHIYPVGHYLYNCPDPSLAASCMAPRPPPTRVTWDLPTLGAGHALPRVCHLPEGLCTASLGQLSSSEMSVSGPRSCRST